MESLDNAAAHALNSLPADEAELFDHTVAEDQYLAKELESFRRVASELIHGLPDIVPAASPELWDRIGREAGIIPDLKPADNAPTRLPRRTLALLTASAAAAVILVVAVTSILSVRNPDLDTRSLAAAAAEQPTSLTFDLSNPTGISDMGAQVVLDADGTGYVIADSLPKLDSDRTYQLWLIVDDRVISAGILGNNPDVVQFRGEGNIAGIAISNEVAGGVVVSEVPPVALWLRDA